MLTEQRNRHSSDIDKRSTLEILEIINTEDARVAQVVRDALPQIAEAVEAVTARLRAGGRLIYVGAGTSGRLAVLDAVECVPTYGTPPEMVQALIAGGTPALTRAVEGAEDDQMQGAADLLGREPTAQDAIVGIAASGRTPYVIGALEKANEIGALSVAISCNRPAPILDLATIAIALPVGPEVISGSTRMKAGTAQKLVLNMLSTATMIKLGKVYGNLMVDVQITNRKLAGRALSIIQEITGIPKDEASDLLEKSGRNPKVAIVMHLLGLDASEAQRRLDEKQGVLRDVIGG